MSDLLADLTPAQKEAVTHRDGPMLVVAGAGSGKTRVVTRRIAWLVAQGTPPWRILALTFTNKAAREMRERVEALVGEAPRWMGTFHSICARLLRADIGLLKDGRTGSFTILDQGDQEGLVKQAMKALDIDPKAFKPSSLLASVSKAKGDFIPPAEYGEITPRDRAVREVYALYEQALRQNNALDFDDLLILGAKLLRESPEALMKYRARFPYLLVDEYQDTNRAQYSLLKALAGPRANIHATGDPDQSIYSWRGADYRNIMDFQNDFPGAKIVRLEENYRSTQPILDAANHLIRHNENRIAKDLFTNRQGGEKLSVVRLQSDRMEASWIADRLAELREKGHALREMAVFYRTNAQSRPLEEALLARALPYQLIGGVRFYERREIKDLLAHLKLRVNPSDGVSLRRLVGLRPGVGEKSLEKVAEAAEANSMAAFAFLAHPNFPELYRANRKMLDLAAFCARLAEVDATRADVAVREILALSGLVESAIAAADKDELSEDRIDNLHAMTARAAEFVASRLAAGADSPAGAEDAADPDADAEEVRAASAIDLAAFLEDVALVADIDSYEGAGDKVTLMTLHSAKGLEFDNVFVTGLEEGLLPHRNSRDDAAVEEERRLFYVGITRAKKRAWITHATTRFIHGSADFAKPSRFLAELPPASVAEEDYGDSLSTAFGGGYGGGRAAQGAWEDMDGVDDPFTDNDFADDDFADAFPDADAVFADEDGFIAPRKKAWPKARPAPRAPRPSKYAPGNLVRHPLFGSGKVLTADRGKIMVQFFSSGTRLLNEDLAQLTKE